MRESTAPGPRAPAALQYRPDIDGLRAIAVLAVILFHINKALLPGGFVGVDIFFVISGYLISAHIFNSAACGQFSFADFYFRRVRRIAPAMLVVIAATLLAAQYLLLPDDAKGTAKSAVWSLASLTNLYFWLFQDVGYFAGSSSELPLLHLWSLSVEEQFYLIWPCLAILLWRLRPPARPLVLVAGIIASFAYAQFSFVADPSFAYFMLPTRCGELLIGALLALAVTTGTVAPIPQRWAAPFATVGLFLIGASGWLIAENSIFPGVLALPPTIGAALIILAGGIGSNRVSSFLSIWPLKQIGIYSYPAYLWHWPLLAFYRYGYGDPGVASGVALFTLTFVLAALTYRYVEQPVRGMVAVKRNAVFGGWALASTVLAVAGAALVYADRIVPSLANATYAQQLALVQSTNIATTRADDICLRKVLSPSDAVDPNCVVGPATLPERVLLFGDSHAAHYVGVLTSFSKMGKFRFRNLQVGSCPPVTGDVKAFVPVRRLADCTDSHAIWLPAIEKAEVLIMGGTWSQYEHTSATFLPMLQAQIRQYAAMGKTVVILGKIPVIARFDRMCREKSLRYPFMDCEAPANAMPEDVKRVNDALRRFAASVPNVRYYDPERFICPAGICSAYGEDRQSRYFDAHHFSVEGSLKVGRGVVDAEGVPPAFDFSGSALAQPMQRASVPTI